MSLKELQQLGVWEMGLLTSFKREIDQRAGIIRLCHLDPASAGYFHDDRFAEQFEISLISKEQCKQEGILVLTSDIGVRELNPGIFQIRGLNGSSHSYVIKGQYMNVMIDSGSDQNFPVLERGLFHIGLKVRDLNLVINSHEHCDHIGANRYFHESAMIAAYRLAASKMIAGDYYVTMYKGNDLNEIPMRVHLWFRRI